MKNRHWWSPQGEDAQRDDRRVERCDDVASLLTALFDGEATEEEARRARLHLLACQRCADVFANWNQTRQILRSEVVPAPPSTLMWRILAACRVAGYARKPEAAPKPARTADPLSPIPPSLLKESILASTVGASRKQPEVPRWRRNPGAWTALAAPALAIWFMALAWQNSSTQLAGTPKQESPSRPASVFRPVSVKPKSFGIRRATPAPQGGTAPARVATAPEIAPEEREVTAPEVRHVTAPVREVREERHIVETRHEVEAPAPVERTAPVESPAPAVTFATVRATAPVMGSLAGLSTSRHSVRLASLADHDTPIPHPQRASFDPLTKSTIAKLAKASGTMRASTPVEPVNTPLVIASTDDSDHSLDDAQSAVDDLRALYATDSTNSDGTELPS
jgi:hypothetical protein